MSFKDKCTTADLISADKSDEKLESQKMTLSNDAYIISELLEALIQEINFRSRGR